MTAKEERLKRAMALQMKSWGNVRGKLRSKEGTPLQGQVTIASKTVDCGAAGEYDSGPLPAGTFTIKAKAPGFSDRRVDVQVSDNTIIMVDFELTAEAT